MTHPAIAGPLVLLILMAGLAVTGPIDRPATALAADMADLSAPAIGNRPRLWRALSGDRLDLDGDVLRLEGVRCPDPSTEGGRAAKALLNTFLRAGHVTCLATGNAATCTIDGYDLADGMLASGYCGRRAEHRAHPPASGTKGPDRGYARNMRHSAAGRPMRLATPPPGSGCRPSGLRAQALPLACFDRSSYSKCPGFPNRAVSETRGRPPGRMGDPRRIVLPGDPAQLSRLPRLPHCP